jgi:hypothetical protein
MSSIYALAPYWISGVYVSTDYEYHSIVTTLRAFLTVLCFTATLAPIALGHEVALKTGRVIQFEKYRVTENLLLYTDSTGNELKVLLSDIDFDRTRELCATDTPPLDLPGLILPNRPQTQTANQSLGDVAKKMRTTDSKVKAQRVFTDDDVSHGESSAPTISADSPKDKIDENLEAAEKYADDLQSKTPRQLGSITARDVQFPGRDAWESKLATARDSLVQTTKTAVFTVRTELKQLSANDVKSAGVTRTVVSDQLYHIQSARQNFEHVLSDGASAAAQWKRTTEPSVAIGTR